ncbi:MAG: DMT family transporter [Planctomycetota bacterium]|nr:DMT family transporter [Planctomycetota bacterium]
MNQEVPKMMPQVSRIWWLLTIGIIGISTSTLWIRLSDSEEVNLALRRLAIAVPVLWLLSKRSGHRVPLKTSGRAVFISGACLALHFGAWMASLAHLSVAVSVVLVYVHPVIVYIIEVIRGQARADGIRLAGVIVTLAGTTLLALSAGQGVDVSAEKDPALGVVLALIGSLAFVGYIFAGRAASRDLPTSVYTCRAYSVAAVFLISYLLIVGQLQAPDSGKEWTLALLLALFPTLLGHTPLNAALNYLPPSVVSTAFLGEVAGAPLLVWMVLGEVPPDGFWFGSPLVVCGIVAVAWRGARERTQGDDESSR